MEKDFGFSWRLLGQESQTPTIKRLEPPQTLQKDFAHTTSSSDVICGCPTSDEKCRKMRTLLVNLETAIKRSKPPSLETKGYQFP
jgi:hypothetical protein